LRIVVYGDGTARALAAAVGVRVLEFASIVEKAHLIDPAGNIVEQVIEHRTDPLTSSVASINAALSEKAKSFFLAATDVQLLTEFQEKSRPGCPFCSVVQNGTRFPPGFVNEGQLRIGKSVAVPNLFSKSVFDSVAIIDPLRHVLFPSQIASDALADAVRVSCELVSRARSREASLVHHVVGMNFLGPGGSSLPHPHFQVQVRRVPYSGVIRLLRLSAAFLEQTGHSYWDALIDEEKQLGERWIGRTGRVEWLAAYAPAHQREIWGVLPGIGSLVELAESDADGFAAGIAKVISFYEAVGSHPFTFAFFSSPQVGSGRHFAVHVKLCSRPPFRSFYSNYDTWFTPKLIGDDVHTQAPEQYAEVLRQRW
jgi:UDPglucose--hexose-1-phosphate uridylyltransferase